MRLHQQYESARCAGRERPGRQHRALSPLARSDQRRPGPGMRAFSQGASEHVLTDLARDNLDRMQAWPVTPGDFDLC